jgi:hypothetical protein
MHFHVAFGSTFTLDPKSSIISPILKSPMLSFNLNSLLVLLLVCRWLTIFNYGFCFVSPLHFSRMFCNILTDEGSFNILMHDCKKSLIILTCSSGFIRLIWSIDGVTSYFRASMLYCVVGKMFSFWNSCRASVKISFSLCASNSFLGSVFFFIHLFSTSSCRTTSFPIFVPPRVTILMFRPSSLTSAEIH